MIVTLLFLLKSNYFPSVFFFCCSLVDYLLRFSWQVKNANGDEEVEEKQNAKKKSKARAKNWQQVLKESQTLSST